MSDLLIILVALGVLIVLGVLVFNWMQEKKYRKRIAQDFKPTKRDVLIEDFQINTEILKRSDVKPAIAKEKLEPTLNYTPSVSTSNESDDAILTQDKSSLSIQQSKPISFEQSEFDSDNKTFKPSSDEVLDETTSTTLSLQDDLPLQNDYSEDLPVASLNLDETALALPHQVHSQIDLIAVLYASNPISAQRVFEMLNAFDEFTQHHFIFGLNASDEWMALDNSSISESFTKLVYSIQLADRGGPVSRAILNRFQHAVESVGLALGAHVEWQGKGDPLNNAVVLDNFCIEVDKTVGFHVVVNQGASFHATKFRGLAESKGLTLKKNGQFIFSSDQALSEDFYIKNYEGNPFSPEMLKSSVMSGITFQLDIPTVVNSAAVFDKMISVAKSFADSLDAQIVDDNRKLIGDIQLEKIRQQLNVINAQMIAKGIIPGSAHALRLFS